ncbi:MAG: hypothetical protein AB7G12_04835 [Thermoanaerobaculia bacterium]
MRRAGLFGVAVAALVWGLSQPAYAGDGDFDQDWGVGGIGAGYTNFRVEAATATRTGAAAFLGADLSDVDEISAIWGEEPGVGAWSSCCGWEFGVPFLERFETRAVMVDREGRALFAGAAGFFPTGAVDRAFVGRSTAAANGLPFGPFDTSFSGSGWAFFDDATFCDTESCRFVDIAETDAGSPRYILLLERTVGGLAADYYLVGLAANGDLDTSFGASGYRQVAAANLGQTAVSRAQLEVDAAGRSYVLHGFFDPDDAGDVDVGLTRFTAGGSLDATWGSAGTFFVDEDEVPAIANVPGALALGPAGQIVFGWTRLTPPLEGGVRVFASGATGAATIGTGFSDSWIRTLLVDGLGRILATRDVGADGFRVDRLLTLFPGGIVHDNSFGTVGSRFVDVDHAGGNGDDTPVALVVEGGDYYVFVDADGSAAEDEHVVVPVRLLGSLLFADGFEWGSTHFWSRTSP